MNDIAHKEATKKAVSAKFRGRKQLTSKSIPLYPQSAEREFQKISDAYMRLLNQTLKAHLPKIKAAAQREKELEARHDDASDLLAVVRRAFLDMGVELEEKTESFNLREKLEKLAHQTEKLSIQQWKKVIKSTLGVDILEDYYMGEFFRTTLNEWVDSNVSLIKSIPKDSLGKMQEIAQNGYKNGKSTTAIAEEIQAAYGVDKNRARFIACDQIAKLNSDITKQQQTDAGVTEYIWSTSDDSKVRKGHAALNKKRFSWSDPPVVDEKSGRRCHPGKDYRCRCVSLPVFDIEGIDIPLAGYTPRSEKGTFEKTTNKKTGEIKGRFKPYEEG